MTSDPSTPERLSPADAQRLFAWADGELSPAEAREFEAELARRPELAAAADALRRAEGALRAAWDDAPADAQADAQASAVAPRARIGWRGWRLAAAAVVLVGLGGLLAVRALTAPAHTIQLADASRLLEGAFEPEVVCDTPEKFADYTREKLGVALRADYALARQRGVELVGWTGLEGQYLGEVGGESVRVLLARGPAGERLALLFRRPGVLGVGERYTAGLSRYRARVGGLVVDEVSPLDHPVVLGLLSVPGEG